MISCIDFDIIRQNFYTASNLQDLFHNIHPKRIVSFIHTIGLTILNFLRHDIAATCVLKVPLNPDHPTNPQTHQPIILSILSICYLHRNNSNAIFCCVSPAIFASLIKADQTAKSALNLGYSTSLPVHCPVLMSHLLKTLIASWQ